MTLHYQPQPTRVVYDLKHNHLLTGTFACLVANCLATGNAILRAGSEKLEKAATVNLKTARTEGVHKVQGSVEPMLAAGLPLPVLKSQNVKHFATRVKFAQNIPGTLGTAVFRLLVKMTSAL